MTLATIVPPLHRRYAYLATEIVVAIDNAWVDAGTAVGRLGAPLYVITAANPSSTVLDERENEHRNAALAGELLERVDTAYHAVGRAPHGDWHEASFAVTRLGQRAARNLGRRYDQVAIFELTRGCQRVVGCFSHWSVERPLDGAGWKPPLESDATLADAVDEALGIHVEVRYVRARRQGWVHDDGVELSCTRCHGQLELFGRDLVSRDGSGSRANAFVCPSERAVLFSHDLPAAYRATAEARRTYLLARRDADAAGFHERHYWCYCIELDDDLGEHPPGRPWIYVGQSSRPPEDRFAQHLAGERASRWVRDHGVRLRPDLYDDQPVLRTHAEALAYERWRFESLAAARWPVKGGT